MIHTLQGEIESIRRLYQTLGGAGAEGSECVGGHSFFFLFSLGEKD